MVTKATAAPVACPTCKSAATVRLALSKDDIEVYLCQDPKKSYPRSDYGGPGCRFRPFAVLPDGTLLHGLEFPAKSVVPPRDSAIESGIIEAKLAEARRVTETKRAQAEFEEYNARLMASKKYCGNLACEERQDWTFKPFCGRCGSETGPKIRETDLPSLFRVACEAEGCPARGVIVNRLNLNRFCPDCGTKYTTDVSRADMAAAKEEA